MPSTEIELKSVQCTSLPIPGADPWFVFEDDEALSVMIDFRSRSSVTVNENDNIGSIPGSDAPSSSISQGGWS
jgi:hypothetical protein